MNYEGDVVVRKTLLPCDTCATPTILRRWEYDYPTKLGKWVPICEKHNIMYMVLIANPSLSE